MAITFYSGHDQQYAICDQSTWNTAALDNAAGQGIHVIGWDFKPTVQVVEMNTAKSQRYPINSDFVVHEHGVIHEIAMPTIPFLKDQGDKFLYAVIQNLTSEGTATPYTKVFAFSQTQPDFSSNSGKFFTLVNKMPVASTSHKFYDAIIRDLTLSCAAGANNGMLAVEATWVALHQIETSNYSGTITYPDVDPASDFFFFHDISTKLIGGNPVVLGDDGFKITISNGALGLGGASGVPETLRLPYYRVTATVQCLWDAYLRASMSNMRAGTGEALALGWGLGGADGYLNFTFNAVKWSATRDLSHAVEGEFVTLTGTAYGTYGGTVPIEFSIANAVDRSW